VAVARTALQRHASAPPVGHQLLLARGWAPRITPPFSGWPSIERRGAAQERERHERETTSFSANTLCALSGCCVAVDWGLFTSLSTACHLSAACHRLTGRRSCCNGDCPACVAAQEGRRTLHCCCPHHHQLGSGTLPGVLFLSRTLSR
jgi:hypothetical protein